MYQEESNSNKDANSNYKRMPRRYNFNGNKINNRKLINYAQNVNDGSVKEYDSNGNIIHCKKPNGYEEWCKYDNNKNLTYYKNSNGYEAWYGYNKDTNSIHYKYPDGVEKWWEFNFIKNIIYYRCSDGSKFEYNCSGSPFNVELFINKIKNNSKE